MHRCLHTLLLILITFSVAIAPLRGAWALPDASTANTGSHCAGMQHDMQQMNHHADQRGKTDSQPHKCKSGCNGSCCDQGCTACLHATTAIPANVIILRDSPAHMRGLPLASNFPERHLKPPLRPPLAIHS